MKDETEKLKAQVNAICTGMNSIVGRINEIEESWEQSGKFVAKEDFESLIWIVKEGSKGAYAQTTKQANDNSEVFKGLQTILKDHGGFMQYGIFQYWFDRDDHDVIDRRRKESR